MSKAKLETLIGKDLVLWAKSLDEFSDSIEFIEGEASQTCEEYKLISIGLISELLELVEYLSSLRPMSISELTEAFPGEPDEGSNVTHEEEVARG